MKIIKNKTLEYNLYSNMIGIHCDDRGHSLNYVFNIDKVFLDSIQKEANAPIPDQEKIERINKIILSKIKELVNP